MKTSQLAQCQELVLAEIFKVQEDLMKMKILVEDGYLCFSSDFLLHSERLHRFCNLYDDCIRAEKSKSEIG